MADVAQLYNSARGTPEQEVFAAVIARDATEPRQEVQVVIPEFSTQLMDGPCRWVPVVEGEGIYYPKRGDPCTVVRPRAGGGAQITEWTPLSETPDETISGGGGVSLPIAQSDVTGLPAALAAKQDASTAATDAELAASLATKQDAATAATDADLAAHEADTAGIHGIANTANLIVEGDSRLTNARTPTAHAASHKDGGSDVIRLDELDEPTAPVDFGGQEAVNAAAGGSPDSLASVEQLNLAVAGLNFRGVVTRASAATLPAHTSYSDPDGTFYLESTGSGVLVFDGVATTGDERFLVMHEGGGASPKNGIYRVVLTGVGGPWRLVRVPLASENPSVPGATNQGDFVQVEAGTHRGRAFYVTTPDPIVVGTTNVEWEQWPARPGPGEVSPIELATTVAGAGLTGGAGSALAVNPDGSTLEISGDQMQVKDNGITKEKIGDLDLGTWFSTRMFATAAATATANRLYYGQIQIPHDPPAITGISYLVGGTSSGNVMAALYSADGATRHAVSASTAQAAASSSQKIPFTSTVDLEPGAYFVALMFSSGTAQFHGGISAERGGGATQGGFTLPSTITPPTSIGTIPLMSTY